MFYSKSLRVPMDQNLICIRKVFSKGLFGTTDRAAPDQLTIPLNKLLWYIYLKIDERKKK